MNKNNFIMPRTFYNTYKHLEKKKPEDAYKFLKAVLAYGFEHVKPYKDDDIWQYGLDVIFYAIDHPEILEEE